MDKSIHFFGQLISLIDDSTITRAVSKYKTDYYVKKFTTKDQLISMLFCIIGKCNSIREVCGAMFGLKEKTKHFELTHLPKRSTLSDANKQRPHEVFEFIYHGLLKQYKHIISDSRIKDALQKNVKIFDSTTISLFQDIFLKIRKKTGRKK